MIENVKAYYVFGKDMNIMDTELLQSNNVDTIFLNYSAIEKYGKESVNNWISEVPFNVYIWVQCFNNGSLITSIKYKS